MVLLPLAHLGFAGHATGPGCLQSCCGGEETPQQTPSGDEPRQGHDHAHCPLCKLLLVPTQACEPAIHAGSTLTEVPAFALAPRRGGTLALPVEQARAPPSRTA